MISNHEVKRNILL